MSERIDFESFDSYLSVNLKNWAARAGQSRSGREHLLQAAARQQWLGKESPTRWLFYWLVRPLVPHQVEVWPWGPFTQSRTWSIHMTTLRMVA